jgi:DNA recombination protein RmuC
LLSHQITILVGEKRTLEEANKNLLVDRERLAVALARQEENVIAAKNAIIQERSYLEQANINILGQFKSLAAEILKERSAELTQTNESKVKALLYPVIDEMTSFRKKIEGIHSEEIKAHALLEKELSDLKNLNKNLSDEAKNLTEALRGSRKIQGNWGEVILERILEMSGLRRGEEYTFQQSFTIEDGKRLQPDIIIKLPQGRDIIIDAKVSLVAYEMWVKAQNENEASIAIKKHLDSLYSHIKGLSERRYQQLKAGNNLDFVVLFIPIEPAFNLALSGDMKLCEEAWEKNVLLVSPSTLLFTLRTIAHLWRQEAQIKNVAAISEQGGKLFDKFVSFVEDLKKIGERLEQAQSCYDSAYGKLSNQRGNLISAAKKLKDLGVKPSKSLPEISNENPIECAN